MSTTEKKAQAPGVARRRQSSGMKWALLYCAAFGVFAFFWMIQKPSTHMPDEGMRYQVVDYIFRHGRLRWGNRGPLQRLKLRFIASKFADKIETFNHTGFQPMPGTAPDA